MPISINGSLTSAVLHLLMCRIVS